MQAIRRRNDSSVGRARGANQLGYQGRYHLCAPLELFGGQRLKTSREPGAYGFPGVLDCILDLNLANVLIPIYVVSDRSTIVLIAGAHMQVNDENNSARMLACDNFEWMFFSAFCLSSS